ncbi:MULTISPECIES: GTPase [Nostocales]|uniref:AIG1-type G domain-containing protein n=2 Tax=Tolypothrix TaxID=111782 RepID=A0A0C1NB23_9CYAN
MRKFLLVGKTGVGKSSFINATFGKYLAPSSEFEACTKIVKHYAQNTPFGDICLIDTPGLAEDNALLDKEYLVLIQREVDLKQLDGIIYITRLNETRFRPDEKQTLRCLTNYLGSEIWNQSWLVLTFAASVSNDVRDAATRQKINHIETFLQSITGENDLEPKFKKFRHKLRVDNLVRGWSQKGVPILSILTKVSRDSLGSRSHSCSYKAAFTTPKE